MAETIHRTPHQTTGDVNDRESKNLSDQGKEWEKNREKEAKKEQEQLLKLQEKWNKRTKVTQEGGDEPSKEDMELFKRVARARKLYHEIRDEVAGVSPDRPDIQDFRDLRAQAYSEYNSLFDELVGNIKRELN